MTGSEIALLGATLLILLAVLLALPNIERVRRGRPAFMDVIDVEAVTAPSDPHLVKTWHQARVRRRPKSRIYWRTLYLDYLAYATDAGIYTVAPMQNVREYLEARGAKTGASRKGEYAVGVALA